MLTSRYSHVISLNGVTTPTVGVGFGDIDVLTAGQFNQGGIIDRVPRYPSYQYVVIVKDPTLTVANDVVAVQALLPDGTWNTIDTLTIPFATPLAQYKQYFGPFLDIRLNATGVGSTAALYGWIGKY